ncbi:hypothetical protein [Flavobacterium sp. FlaQc-47]|jgi:hypothetical protein
METLRKTMSIKNSTQTILHVQNGESKIPKWQIDEVRKRTQTI